MKRRESLDRATPGAPIRLAYVLAASHSGSTLLSMLLNSHPEVCTVGELKVTSLGDVDTYRCSCRALVRECEFWTGIHDDMARRGVEFDLARPGTDLRSAGSAYVRRLLRPLHRGPALEAVRDIALSLSPSWRAHLSAVLEANEQLMSCVLARRGCRVIVDSSKDAIRLKYLLRSPGLDVRVIRLVRDGRAVMLTYVDPAGFADAADPALRAGGSGNVADPRYLRLGAAAASLQWKRSNEEADAAVATLPSGQWTEVRYEDLCVQPEQTLRRLFAFLGVDAEARRANFRAVEHHVIGNGMRLDSASEVRLDDRWRTNLGEAELRTFESIAGPLNRRFGYA